MNGHVPRQRSAPSLAATTGFIAMGLLSLIHVPAVRAAPAAQGGSARSLCTDVDQTTGLPLSTRVISPSMVRICDTAEVSVTVKVSCEVAPLHVMISIDRSGSMAGRPLQDAVDATDALLDALIAENLPNIRAGEISHGDPPRIDQKLTDDLSMVKTRIHGLNAEGQDNLPQSITMARQELVNERSKSRAKPVDVMVVLSGGGLTHLPAEAVKAATLAKAQAILVIAVCIDKNTPDSCNAMKNVATSSHYYFQGKDSDGLADALRKIAHDLTQAAGSLRSLVVQETLPAGLAYVDKSARPAAAYDPISRTLRWDLSEVLTGGQGLGYRVQPSELYTYTLSTQTRAAYRDSLGASGSIVVPTAVLRVPFRCDQPVATQVSPPTDAPTPTHTQVPPAPSPTSTHAPMPRPVYLPMLHLTRP